MSRKTVMPARSSATHGSPAHLSRKTLPEERESRHVLVCQPVRAIAFVDELADGDKRPGFFHALFRRMRRQLSVRDVPPYVLTWNNRVCRINRPVLAPYVVEKDKAGVFGVPLHRKAGSNVAFRAKPSPPPRHGSTIDQDPQATPSLPLYFGNMRSEPLVGVESRLDLVHLCDPCFACADVHGCASHRTSEAGELVISLTHVTRPTLRLLQSNAHRLSRLDWAKHPLQTGVATGRHIEIAARGTNS